MAQSFRHIFLADDDEDDRLLFIHAVEKLKLPVKISTVTDGEQLLKSLSRAETILPDAIFVDLNMPRKNGYTCLQEIKSNKTTAGIPVVIFSTSYEPGIAELLYDRGAHYYIQKPGDFNELKKLIHQTLTLLQGTGLKPPKEKFLIKIPDFLP